MGFISIIWALLGFILIISEFFIPGLVIIFFGIGALLTAIISAIIPGLSSLLFPQILIWLGLSTLSIISMRRFFKKTFWGRQLSSHEHDYDDGAKVAKVLERVGPEEHGRISYKGTSWDALSFDKTYEEGAEVWILKKEGMTYYVGDPFLTEIKTET